jgi:hypothetical protein
MGPFVTSVKAWHALVRSAEMLNVRMSLRMDYSEYARTSLRCKDQAPSGA